MGFTSLRRFCWPRVNFSHGSGYADRQGQQESFAARRVGCARRVTGQGGAAVICLVDDRATGFGSGCGSPADSERLQKVFSRHRWAFVGEQAAAPRLNTEGYSPLPHPVSMDSLQ